MKINYTNYCNKNLTEETKTSKVKTMFEILKAKLIEMGIHGKVGATYYTDGNVKVMLNGEYYNIFNTLTGQFFSGYVGDSE